MPSVLRARAISLLVAFVCRVGTWYEMTGQSARTVTFLPSIQNSRSKLTFVLPCRIPMFVLILAANCFIWYQKYVTAWGRVEEESPSLVVSSNIQNMAPGQTKIYDKEQTQLQQRPSGCAVSCQMVKMNKPASALPGQKQVLLWPVFVTQHRSELCSMLSASGQAVL